MRRYRRSAALLVALVLTASSGAAQRPGRIATTTAALITSPLFFHGKQIAVFAQVASTGDTAQIEGTAKPVFLVFRERGSRSGGEIRGEFWDIGRLQEDDSRFSTVDFRPILEAATQGRWPNRDQVFLITGATIVESEAPEAATIRAIALAPQRFEGRSVTLAGRFKGRNLYGDLPRALGKSKWDFVLQSADAAVWVSGLRPRGEGFDLDPSARVDTGRWLEVTGVVRSDDAQVWVEATAVKETSAQQEAQPEVIVELPPEPPPAVIFSAPLQDDVDVGRDAPIRMQFSRDMDGRTFEGRVRVTYAVPAGGQAPPVPAFTAAYNPGNRALEIRFKAPLERFQRVSVELLEGITAVDGQPLAPWTLTFSVGG